VARALPPERSPVELLDRPLDGLFGTEEAPLRCIIQANIDRFDLLLKTETDPIKRAMIVRLLAEEKGKKAMASAVLATEKAC